MDDEQTIPQELNYEQLLWLQIKKCLDLGSRDFYGGDWQEREVVVGGYNTVIKYYQPNTGKEFLHAVKMLASLLADEVDDEMGWPDGDEDEEWARALFTELMHLLARQGYKGAQSYTEMI